MNAIEIVGLTKTFGSRTAVDALNLSVLRERLLPCSARMVLENHHPPDAVGAVASVRRCGPDHGP